MTAFLNTGTRWSAVLASVILLGCNGGLADGFIYNKSVDKFAGTTTSTATKSVASDSDSNLTATVIVSCQVKTGTTPDFESDLYVEIDSFKKDGDPAAITGLNIKWGSKDPVVIQPQGWVNESKFNNVFNADMLHYDMIFPISSDEAAADAAADASNTAVGQGERPNSETLRSKTLAFRYETAGGVTSDVLINFDDPVVHHVLEDCGWKPVVARAQAASSSLSTSQSISVPGSAPAPSVNSAASGSVQSLPVGENPAAPASSPSPNAIAGSRPAVGMNVLEDELTPWLAPDSGAGCELAGKAFGLIYKGGNIIYQGQWHKIRRGFASSEDVTYSGDGVQAVFRPSGGNALLESPDGSFVAGQVPGAVTIRVGSDVIRTLGQEECSGAD